jgi:hypothetical protein
MIVFCVQYVTDQPYSWAVRAGGMDRPSDTYSAAGSVFSSHRVHTERQLPLSDVHFIMLEKLAQPVVRRGVHAHPLSLYLPSRKSCRVRSS